MSQSFWKQMLIIMLFMISFNGYYAYLAQQGSQSAEISYSRFRSELTADLTGHKVEVTAITGHRLGGEDGMPMGNE